MLGAMVEDDNNENVNDLEGRMALIAGTSCCHMFTSKVIDLRGSPIRLTRFAAAVGPCVCSWSLGAVQLSHASRHIPQRRLLWGIRPDRMAMSVCTGGQSTAGKLISHVTAAHPAHDEWIKASEEKGVHKYEVPCFLRARK